MHGTEVPTQRTRTLHAVPAPSHEKQQLDPVEVVVPLVSEVVTIDVDAGPRGRIPPGAVVRVEIGDRPSWDLITSRPAQRIAEFAVQAARVQVSGSDPDAVEWFSRELRVHLRREAEYQQDAADRERAELEW